MVDRFDALISKFHDTSSLSEGEMPEWMLNAHKVDVITVRNIRNIDGFSFPKRIYCHCESNIIIKRGEGDSLIPAATILLSTILKRLPS